MAPIWGWIVAYALGFLLVQLLVYWYFGEDGPSIGQPTPETSDHEHGRRGVDSRQRDEVAVGETVRCPHCGAENEFAPSYTYCRACAREIM